MKKIFFLILLFGLALMANSQTVILTGKDTLANGTTLTSTVIKVSETNAVPVYPTLQTYVDYVSGTANCYITLWHSLDGVRYDTVGTDTGVWNFNYDAEADGTVILSSQTWETPIVTKYLKATARGHTGTQVLFPRIILSYVKVPLKFP